MKKIKISTMSLIAILLSSSISFAAPLGGKWAKNPKYYSDGFSSVYKTAIEGGANSWDAAFSNIGSTIRIEKSTLMSSDVGISIMDYGTTTWDGRAYSGPNPNSGIYTYGSMEFNTKFMDLYEPNHKRGVAAHEWGHILGLGHVSSTDQLMYGGGLSNTKIYAPTTGDIAVLRSIYK